MSRVRVSSPAPSSMEPRAKRENDRETRTPFECPARQRIFQVKPFWHGSPRANNLVTRSILDGATRASARRSGDSNAVRTPCAPTHLPSEAILAWFAPSEQSHHPLPRWGDIINCAGLSGNKSVCIVPIQHKGAKLNGAEMSNLARPQVPPGSIHFSPASRFDERENLLPDR